MQFKRYAIYYTAPPGPLADFGAAWLGWDIATGLQVRHPLIHGLKEDIAALTETPRKYGFHGTVKPPFYLAEGFTEQDLSTAARRLCKRQLSLTLQGLELSPLGRFLALTVTGDTSGLENLAANIVQGLDEFRAPASEQELARRRKANLTEAQELNLQQWGYPYVMQDFRFHLTLTGKLPKSKVGKIFDQLEPALVNTLPIPFEINNLTLVGEDSLGRFHTIENLPLG